MSGKTPEGLIDPDGGFCSTEFELQPSDTLLYFATFCTHFISLTSRHFLCIYITFDRRAA